MPELLSWNLRCKAMKFINLTFDAPRDEVVKLLKNNEEVNAGVKFDTRGKPLMKIKERPNGKIRITCEMLGRPTKDNGFLVGTYFSGKLTESNGETHLKGYLVTAPIYHLILIGFLVWYIVQCIVIGGFSPIPLILVLFDIMLFKDEFRKQGYITRYLYRAVRILRQRQNK